MASSQSRRASGSRAPRRAASRGRPAIESSESPSTVASPGSADIDRGRSRQRRPSNPFSDASLRRKGYTTIMTSFGKAFNVEKRWSLVREMGSGAYGVVGSFRDEVSGETVAVKLVTRVFDKVQLAKRALREITLLRHFASHENITGLIDVDAISRDFSEIYIFMEPMEADLHQIIKSGQSLTNEHVQYFLYQVLRGMKYVHSAGVIHRDLKPGNLLVNADCELKICDFGLSRGYDQTPDENTSRLTEYVATRWYRAPEILVAFRRYDTAIDVWSIGCILAELLIGKPLFKGKDYVDQLNKVLDILGTPSEDIIRQISSEKAQVYVRSLPYKKTIPFDKILPSADPLAIDLLTKMLQFDPAHRISVSDALEHPWLSSYHDLNDEPVCPSTFDKWRDIEGLETLDEFREALWNEIEDYRREVRGVVAELVPETAAPAIPTLLRTEPSDVDIPMPPPDIPLPDIVDSPMALDPTHRRESSLALPASAVPEHQRPPTPTDPLISYARRGSILQPSRPHSAYNSPHPSHHQHLPSWGEGQGVLSEEPQAAGAGIAFPTQSYVVPARTRTASLAGGETRKLLRTLSTVSIHESVEGLAGGLAGVAPIGKYIVDRQTTGGDAPASEMPRDFGIDEEDELSMSAGKQTSSGKEEKKRRFQIE